MLTVVEVAARFGWNRVTIGDLAQSGVIKSRKIGRSWCIEEGSVQEFARRNGLPEKANYEH